MPLTRQDIVFDYFFIASLNLLALAVIVLYDTAWIKTDSLGITQHTLGVCRFLRWEQVERFHMSGDALFKFGNVVGAGTRIRFWIGIADLEELKAEIARRAVNSRNRTWDEAETPGSQTSPRDNERDGRVTTWKSTPKI